MSEDEQSDDYAHRADSYVRERDSFRAVVDSMPHLVWAAREDGYVDFFNRGWFEFTGTTFEEVKGSGWLSVIDPNELPRTIEAWNQSIATGQPFEMACRVRNKNGDYRWFLARARRVRSDDGMRVRWIGTHTDIDNLKAAEAQRASVAFTNTSRQDVLAVVSHDLRNPLNIVLLGARQIELMADATIAGHRTKRAARTILRAVDRMTRLVGDLLDIARLEAGQSLPLEIETAEIVEVVRQATQQLEPLAAARRLTLDMELCTPTRVPCDRERIEQVLSNLIGNAIKFTREGGTISARVERVGNEVVVSIRDTGAGIGALQLPHIFKAYWQSDTEQKRGAGLGLSIARAIVEAHHGRIWVESTKGEGSTFYFALPADLTTMKDDQ